MYISIFDLFSIGIGPSSSHTVGPMRAARRFLEKLRKETAFEKIDRVKIDLYGSLALTGKGHGTDIAVLLGLEGEKPESIQPDQVPEKMQKIRKDRILMLFGEKPISFREESDLLFLKTKQLPFHPNGLRFTAFSQGKELLNAVYYSVGGGFVVAHEERDQKIKKEEVQVPFPFSTGQELLDQCSKSKLSIKELILENEKTFRSEKEIREGILKIWKVMQSCVARGCREEGVLPGGLGVKRRAPHLFQELSKRTSSQPGMEMEWLSLFALAVNEENAAGGRVVTAPTNGAAGIIPSILHYYEKFFQGTEEGIITIFLVAGAMGSLFKQGASISAAEMGCMGEVGVASAMAAAGLAAAFGATNEQIENAAEIGMEHNLGLTCDPISGLVQIPCIERNTMGAVKAVNAALLALRGDGTHRVSLDQVIATMRETGKNMQSIYKETSLGGLAVNVPEC